MVETRTARVHLSAEGVVRVAISPGVQQTSTDADANIDAAVQVTASVRRPILVDISAAETLTPDVRRLYSGRRLTSAFTALGLLVAGNPVGRMLGNVYFRIAKPAIPIKLFEVEAEALAWLVANR